MTTGYNPNREKNGQFAKGTQGKKAPLSYVSQNHVVTGTQDNAGREQFVTAKKVIFTKKISDFLNYNSDSREVNNNGEKVYYFNEDSCNVNVEERQHSDSLKVVREVEITSHNNGEYTLREYWSVNVWDPQTEEDGENLYTFDDPAEMYRNLEDRFVKNVPVVSDDSPWNTGSHYEDNAFGKDPF